MVGFLNFWSNVHGNFSTSGNIIDGVPTKITNYVGEGGDSVGGGINDVNVKTITEAITL